MNEYKQNNTGIYTKIFAPNTNIVGWESDNTGEYRLTRHPSLLRWHRRNR